MQDVIRVFESLCNISSLHTSHRLIEGLVGNGILLERVKANISKPVKLIFVLCVFLYKQFP